MKNKNSRKGLLTLIFQGIAPGDVFQGSIRHSRCLWLFPLYGIATGAGVMIGGMIDGDI